MMIRTCSKFEKLLDTMQTAGGNASLAAENAYSVIKELRLLHKDRVNSFGKRTKYGENRVKNCMKFNLGNGYRLITVKKSDVLRLVFLGSHDECDNWLENNRGSEMDPEDRDTFPCGVSFSEATDKSESWKMEPASDEYEERLSRRIDDKVLRQVFSGLTGTIPDQTTT